MNRRKSRGVWVGYGILGAATFAPLAAHGGDIPTSPAVNFTNSSSAGTGSTAVNLVDSYANLMLNDPTVVGGRGVMEQNINIVIQMTKARTADQTLAAIHDDRTQQPYSVLNGLGPLTSSFMTGIGASTTATAPNGLTPTSYIGPTSPGYASAIAANINYLNSASNGNIGFNFFGNGTPTPLTKAADFLNSTIRNNASTEPPKRTFERYMGSTLPVTNPASITPGTISPLDARYGNYNMVSNPTGLTTADTANFVVPSYFTTYFNKNPAIQNFYGSVNNWVKGFTVTQAMVDAQNVANGTSYNYLAVPPAVPGLGTYDANGVYTTYTTFAVGSYVPGIGTAPRPWRLSNDVNVPTQLWQITNQTNPYGDGGFISGHTNLAYNQAFGLAFLVPQEYQSLLLRASDLGNNRILAGMHSPLDVIGGRIFATAIAATNIWNALYDSNGNRVDWTNPANTAAYGVYQAYTHTQSYLSQSCGVATVQACIQLSQASAAASNPFTPASKDSNLDPANTNSYTYRMTYGLQLAGASTTLPEVVPTQAQVLLLTRFPYLTDAQRTDILQTTALPSGFALLDGNTYDGWGRLNYYKAANGYGAFNSAVSVTMDASQGGYNAFDIWSNDIGGAGSLSKSGTGTLVLAGKDTYSGGTTVGGGALIVAGSVAGPLTVGAGGTLGGFGTVGSTTVNGGTLAPGLPSVAGLTGQTGTLTIAGNLQLNAGSNYLVALNPTSVSSTSVSGTANIASTATATAVLAPGLYTVGSRFTVLTTAANGLTGSFSSVTANSSGPVNVAPRLSYDGQNAYFTLAQAALPTLPATTTGNGSNVAAALGRAISNGGTLPTSLQGLYFLSPSALAATYNQLASQAGGGKALSVSTTMNGFLGTVLNFDGAGRGGFSGGNNPVMSFAPDAEVSPTVAQAYAAVTPKDVLRTKAVPMSDPTWNVWGSAFGGGSRFNGDANAGTQDVTSTIYGLAVGADYRLSPDTTLGFALSGGGTNFSLSGGAGSGTTDFIQGAAFAGQRFGNAYASATLASGAHWVTQTRSVATGLGIETLTASFTAPTLAGRIESGYRFALGQFGLTPYGAVQVQQVWTPSFGETASAGTGGTALNYGASSATLPRTELGARADQSFAGGNIVLRGRLAWVHDHNRDAAVAATFQALPGASFTTLGTQRPADSALVSAMAESKITPRLTLASQVDGELGRGATSWSGSVKLRYGW